MRYWWVNQNQTFRQETKGGYLWSPKRKANGSSNPFYEFMKEVSPGDLIFSFEGTFVRAIGIAQSNAYEAPKPSEFGNAGPHWDSIGWRVDVRFFLLENQIKPVDHMERLQVVLPEKYSPLKRNGGGNQGVYLTLVSPRMADVLISLIGEEANSLRQQLNWVHETPFETSASITSGLDEWEEHLVEKIKKDESVEETQKLSLILARRGQGVFKQNVIKIESHCRITRVENLEHLRASHIKPWRDCKSSEDRLVGDNGLLLTPSIDHLFDRGFISFEDSGELLLSPAADEKSLEKMGVQTDRTINVGGFTENQKEYLSYHREEVFLKARIRL